MANFAFSAAKIVQACKACKLRSYITEESRIIIYLVIEVVHFFSTFFKQKEAREFSDPLKIQISVYKRKTNMPLLSKIWKKARLVGPVQMLSVFM